MVGKESRFAILDKNIRELNKEWYFQGNDGVVMKEWDILGPKIMNDKGSSNWVSRENKGKAIMVENPSINKTQYAWESFKCKRI